jgi:hypothetical protein
MSEPQKDLDLKSQDAESVTGGRKKSHKRHTSPTAIKVGTVAGSTLSTPQATGTPSPLSAEPVESYMAGSPEADQTDVC